MVHSVCDLVGMVVQHIFEGVQAAHVLRIFNIYAVPMSDVD